MAGGKKDLTYTIGVDASDASSSLKGLERQVRTTMRNLDDELDEGASAGDKLAASLEKVTAGLKEDFNSAAIAAERMGDALKQAGSAADVGDTVAELKRMGLSFDEITADADKLAAALKQLDDVKLAGVRDLDAVAPGLSTKLDNVGKSADSSKNALANMIGNSVQDVSGLGGAIGVAAGQLAEFGADAKFSGESLGSVFKNMAAVAGPILLITGAISAVTGAMQAQKRRAEEAAKTTEQLGEAMEGAADDSIGLAQSLRDNEAALREFDASVALLGELGTILNDAGKAIPLLGRLFQDTSVDIVDAMGDAGLSVYQFAAALDGDAATRAKFLRDLDAFRVAGFITSDQFHALSLAFGQYADSIDDARAAQKLYNVDQREANALLKEMTAQADPLSQMGATWATLFDDMRDGSIDTLAAADAINVLADALGLTQAEIIAIADAHLSEELEAQRQASAEAAKAATAHSIALRGAARELLSIGSTLESMSRRGDALSAIFDLGDSGFEALSSIHDIEQGVRDLRTFIKEEGVPNIFDPKNVDAGEFLDKIGTLREPIQAKVAEAFAAGGPEAATAVADQYVAQIVESLGGKLTADQVRTLLGLGDLEATVAIALEASKVEAVKAQLAVLTGVSGETPLTASIALALDAGTITPEAAEILVQGQLGAAGVQVPATLDTPDTEAAIREATAFVTTSGGVSVPATLNPEGFEGDVQGLTSTEYDPIELGIRADSGDADRTVETFRTKRRETAPITAVAYTANAEAQIAAVANKERTAMITAEARTANAEAQINRTARDREVVLTARVVESDIARWYRLNGRTG